MVGISSFLRENSNVIQLSLAKWTATIIYASHLELFPLRRMFVCQLCFIRLRDSSDGESVNLTVNDWKWLRVPPLLKKVVG